MIIKRGWSLGLGSVFSFIVMYFIFLYSREKGWVVLAFISKWYLIVAGILIALPLLVVLFVVLLSLLVLLISVIRLKILKMRHNRKKSGKSDNYIDAEYKVRE